MPLETLPPPPGSPEAPAPEPEAAPLPDIIAGILPAGEVRKQILRHRFCQVCGIASECVRPIPIIAGQPFSVGIAARDILDVHPQLPGALR